VNSYLESAMRSAAHRIGVSTLEYMTQRANGFKWCSGHRRFEKADGFGAGMGALGKQGRCREFYRKYRRKVKR
jgi:hypothetical protein